MMDASTFSGMDVLPPTEAAKRLGVSPITLRKWADKGLLRALTTLGGHRRYPLSEVERLLKRLDKRNDAPSRIMIVDDDRFLPKLLQENLLKLNDSLVIAIANDGFEAGRKLALFKPDIILLDLKMPGMDGFEVCRQIKSDPSTSQIRIIAMTAFPSTDNIKRIIAAGAETCLAKPIDHAELLDALCLPELSLAEI